MTQDWKEEYNKVWQISVDHIADNRAGCYGKMDMVKKELQAFIESTLKEQRLAVLEEMEKEVENVHGKYFDGIASISEYQKGYLQAQMHISAMLNNLRVK